MWPYIHCAVVVVGPLLSPQCMQRVHEAKPERLAYMKWMDSYVIITLSLA